jgi:hypothetical protein
VGDSSSLWRAKDGRGMLSTAVQRQRRRVREESCADLFELSQLSSVSFHHHPTRIQMWQHTLTDPAEREAFHSLLSEYFDSRPNLPTFTAPQTHSNQPARAPVALPPRTLPPPAFAPRAGSSYGSPAASPGLQEGPKKHALPAGLTQGQSTSFSLLLPVAGLTVLPPTAVAGGFNASNRKTVRLLSLFSLFSSLFSCPFSPILTCAYLTVHQRPLRLKRSNEPR